MLVENFLKPDPIWTEMNFTCVCKKICLKFAHKINLEDRQSCGEVYANMKIGACKHRKLKSHNIIVHLSAHLIAITLQDDNYVVLLFFKLPPHNIGTRGLQSSSLGCRNVQKFIQYHTSFHLKLIITIDYTLGLSTLIIIFTSSLNYLLPINTAHVGPVWIVSLSSHLFNGPLQSHFNGAEEYCTSWTRRFAKMCNFKVRFLFIPPGLWIIMICSPRLLCIAAGRTEWSLWPASNPLEFVTAKYPAPSAIRPVNMHCSQLRLSPSTSALSTIIHNHNNWERRADGCVPKMHNGYVIPAIHRQS